MSRRGSMSLAVLAAILALAGLTAAYVKLELSEPEAFADRSVDALQSKEVREVIAEQIAVELLERRSPDLVASRPLVLAGVEAVLGTEEFARVLRRSAATAHALLLREDRDVIVELEQARDLLARAVESASPELARQIPADLSPRIAEIRRNDLATRIVRVADGAGVAALPLLAAAAAALLTAVALAHDRRRALAAAGLLLAAGAGGGLAAMAGLRAQMISHAGEVGVLSVEDARAAAGAGWDALAGGLEQWLLILGVGGVAVAGGALVAEARLDRAAALRHGAEILAGGRLPRALSVLRGLALAGLGALVLLGAEPVLGAAVATLGTLLVLLGLGEALSAAGRGGHGRGSAPRPGSARPPGAVAASSLAPRRRRRALGVTAAAIVGMAAVGVVLYGSGGPPAPPEGADITACNGLPVLCDRRLGEVVLPGTHNSMAAADRPGWFFANQIRPIPRQLDDGIRFLMVDPHYGVVDAQGRVRTDLRAEGTSRNRVARRLGAEAVATAERLAGRLGLVPSQGRREIFLCHTLCELGAERIGSALGEVRGFLERRRSEVLVLLLESSVEPEEVEEEIEEADLAPYLATLQRGQPLPTLREMIASGRRLVVLDEGDGGRAPWHHPGFVFVQDTRIDSLLESRTACEPGRGTPDSPLVAMNHWIDRFPPPLVANREVSDRRSLLRRARSCAAQLGRGPNLIAVDFYERGDVIGAARRLNLSRAAGDRG